MRPADSPLEDSLVQNSGEILVNLERLESLLPGKRILDTKDLAEFRSFLWRLWEQSKNMPEEDFRVRAFALLEHFRHYIEFDPGPHRPSRLEDVAKLTRLLPPQD